MMIEMVSMRQEGASLHSAGAANTSSLEADPGPEGRGPSSSDECIPPRQRSRQLTAELRRLSGDPLHVLKSIFGREQVSKTLAEIDAEFLAAWPPEYFADLNSPIYSTVFHSPMAMQTILAIRETVSIMVTVAAIVLLFFCIPILMWSVGVATEEREQCPPESTWVSSYWFWNAAVTAGVTFSFIVGVIYWHVFRRLPGAFYRRFFLVFSGIAGGALAMIGCWSAALWIAINVGGSESGIAWARRCCVIDADGDRAMRLSVYVPLAYCVFGWGWVYSAWLGGYARDERKAWWALSIPHMLSAFLHGLASVGAASLSANFGTASFAHVDRPFCCNEATHQLAKSVAIATAATATQPRHPHKTITTATLVAVWLISMPVRRKFMVKRLTAKIEADKEAYTAAWHLGHAQDSATINRLASICRQLPSFKPHQVMADAPKDVLGITPRRMSMREKRNIDYAARGNIREGELIMDRFELFRRAHAYHTAVGDYLHPLVVPAGDTAVWNMEPVKRPVRVYQKVLRSYRGDFSLVCDMLRCSGVYFTLPELACGLDRLVADPGVEILQVKNRFDPDYDPERSLGYRDLKLLVTLRGLTHGYVVEIQLHLQSIEAIKSRKGHEAYVQARDRMGQ